MLHITRGGMQINGSPFHLIVASASADPTACITRGAGATVGQAGVPTTFSIVSHDRFGNPRHAALNSRGALAGGSTASCSPGPSGASFEDFDATLKPLLTDRRCAPVRCRVAPCADGSCHNVQYTATVAGEYALIITLSGELLPRLATVTVLPGPTCAASSHARSSLVHIGVRSERALY